MSLFKETERCLQSDHNFKTKKTKLPRSNSFSSSRTIILRGKNRAPLIKSEALDKEEETHQELPVKLLRSPDVSETQSEPVNEGPVFVSPLESRTFLAYTILSPFLSTSRSSSLSTANVTIGGDPLAVTLRNQEDLEKEKVTEGEMKVVRNEGNNLDKDDADNTTEKLTVSSDDSVTLPETSEHTQTSKQNDVIQGYDHDICGESEQTQTIEESIPVKQDLEPINQDHAVNESLDPAKRCSIPVKRYSPARPHSLYRPVQIETDDDVCSEVSSEPTAEEEGLQAYPSSDSNVLCPHILCVPCILIMYRVYIPRVYTTCLYHVFIPIYHVFSVNCDSVTFDPCKVVKGIFVYVVIYSSD